MDKKTKPVNVRLWVTPQRGRKRSPNPTPPADPTPATPATAPGSASPVKVNIWVSSQRQPQRRAAPQSSDRAITPVLETNEPEEDEAYWEDDDDATIQVWITPKVPLLQRGIVRFLVFWIFWLAIATVVVGGGWTAVKLILNPGSVSWLSWLMPEWNRDPLVSNGAARPLSDVRRQLQQTGFSLGEPIAVGGNTAPHTLVVPVLQTRTACPNTGGTCEAIVELRAYRTTDQPTDPNPIVTLIDRVAVEGPPEFTVLAPLTEVSDTVQGSSDSVHFNQLATMPGAPTDDDADWLQLSGLWTRNNQQVMYGQVVYYDTQLERLLPTLQWSSPKAEMAQWKQITEGGTPELVVNQTIGLEPNMQVYTAKLLPDPAAPVKFEAIALNPPALNQSSYKAAIALAQNGLWTPAQQRLEAFKQQRAQSWTATAQAQLDLVKLHAQFTAAQAEQDWASPSQTMMAQLIDGRWTPALTTLKSALADGFDVTRLLRDDSGTLWRRINAALQVSPRQPDVLAWGTLVMSARQNRSAAIAWLQQHLEQGQSTPVRLADLDPRLQQTVGLLAQVAGSAPVAADHPSRLVGAVEKLASLTASDWLRPQSPTPPQLDPGQSWYRVTLDSFHDGRQWQRSPFNLRLSNLDAANQLWNQLGLGGDAAIQIQYWTPEGIAQTLPGTIQGVRYSGGLVQVLVSADTVAPPDWQPSPPPLATTPDTLSTVSGDSTTLADLYAQNPQWVDRFLPQLSQDLEQTGFAVPVSDRTTDPLGAAATWTVQLIDVTGNQQPDAIFKFQPSNSTGAFVFSDSPAMRTVIVADTGTVLYNDVGQDQTQSVVAIATTNDNSPPLIITRTGDGYRIRRWSAQAQQLTDP